MALMIMNLVVRTPESIVSFGFYALWAYFRYFLHVYKCNFNILVCKHSEKTEMYRKLWLKIDACVKEPEMAVLDSLERTVCCIAHT